MDNNISKNIISRLPQKYPFLFIDKISSCTDKELVSIKNVSINEAHFQGHFINQPIMPGVLIIEVMAQSCAAFGINSLLEKRIDLEQNENDVQNIPALISGIDRVRFLNKVVPGDQLVTTVILVTNKIGFSKFKCQSEVKGEKVATAEIIVSFG